jgi:hypothetical protein
MQNDELDSLLKSATPPARPEEYWDAFPGNVTAGLRQQQHAAARAQFDRDHKPGWPAWAFGLAAACVVVGFVIGFWRGRAVVAGDHQFAQAQQYYREIATLFPNQLQAIVLDADGPHLVLADKPDVPASTPYFVKICGPGGCRSFVTFSGQQVQVNGEPCEVLADARGQVMVVGSHTVWSEASPSGAVRVMARPLQTLL